MPRHTFMPRHKFMARHTVLTHRAAALCASALLATGCLAAPKSPSPAATAQTRKEIQALYDRQGKGLEAKDVNAFFAGVAPDAVTYDTKGRAQTAAQGRQVIGAMMGAMKQGHGTSAITAITLKGADNATVTVKQHLTMVLTPPGQQKTATLVTDDVARDEWVKTAKGWQMKVSHNLSESTTINGKPANN